MAKIHSVVAGQVWKVRSFSGPALAVVTGLRIDPDGDDILASVIEIGDDGSIIHYEFSCDRLRKNCILIYDATLTNPRNVN